MWFLYVVEEYLEQLFFSVDTDILKFQIIFLYAKKSMCVVGVDFPPLHIRPTHIGQFL
nr:MAG TPA: hypothetical protein [Caudoviricetes sp.]